MFGDAVTDGIGDGGFIFILTLSLEVQPDKASVTVNL